MNVSLVFVYIYNNNSINGISIKHRLKFEKVTEFKKYTRKFVISPTNIPYLHTFICLLLLFFINYE